MLSGTGRRIVGCIPVFRATMVDPWELASRLLVASPPKT